MTIKCHNISYFNVSFCKKNLFPQMKTEKTTNEWKVVPFQGQLNIKVGLRVLMVNRAPESQFTE